MYLLHHSFGGTFSGALIDPLGVALDKVIPAVKEEVKPSNKRNIKFLLPLEWHFDFIAE
jgi:hypothetical protein